jgi:hypothetical protein
MIPRVFHMIWLGQNRRPHQNWASRLEELHPKWEVKIWSGDALAGCPYSFHDLRQASNWLRLQLLWRHGGVYLDCDIEPLRNIEPLLAGLDAAVTPMPNGRVCNSFLAASPGHPWIGTCCDLLLTADPDGYMSMSSSLVMRALEKHQDVMSLPLGAIRQDPSGIGHPAGDSYAIHHFDHMRKTRRNSIDSSPKRANRNERV